MAKCWVSMTDRFMSGWGRAEGKTNKLVVSCNSHEEAVTVSENAKNRGDMDKIKILEERPEYPDDEYHIQHHGVEQGDYENWFKPGWFSKSSKMTKKQVKDTQRNFINLAKVFTNPTGALTEKLHGDAINERLLRFIKLSGSSLTAKQIEDFTFKLTDAEKLSILSRASHRAPLRREHMEEMQRLFLNVYGAEAYQSIFGDEAPEPKPDWLDIWGNK